MGVAVGGLTNGQYISGTNINITFSAGAGERPMPHDQYNEPWQTAVLTGFTATIGGETVSPPDNPIPTGDDYGMQVRFMSNHFEHGEEVDLELSATFLLTADSGTNTTITVTTTIPLTVSVYNYGGCLGSVEFEGTSNANEHAAAAVASSLQSMNHETFCGTTISWTDTTLEDLVKGSTVFYLSGHGSPLPEIYGNGTSQINSTSFDWRDIKGWLDEVSEDHVPVNLAYLSSCHTALYSNVNPPGLTNQLVGQDPIDPTLNHAFSTGSFLYETLASTCIDRAQVGWRVYRWSNWAKFFDEAFFVALGNGQTVDEARNEGMQALRESSIWEDHGLDPEYEGLDNEDFVAVFGDFYMTLNSVYNGSSTNHDGWYWAHH